MARIPAGREVLQVTVDTEIATLLRVKAALRRVTVGDLVQELAHHAYDRDLDVERWVMTVGQPKVTTVGQPKVTTVGQPKVTTVGQPKVTKVGQPELMKVGSPEETRVGRPMVAPSSPQGRRKVGTDTMTWDELVAGLEKTGKTHKQLRDYLGLSNTSPWAKDGVPPRHVPKIREFLAQE